MKYSPRKKKKKAAGNTLGLSDKIAEQKERRQMKSDAERRREKTKTNRETGDGNETQNGRRRRMRLHAIVFQNFYSSSPQMGSPFN